MRGEEVLWDVDFVCVRSLMLEPDDKAACDLLSGPINGRGRQQSIIAIGERETGVMLLEDY